MLDWPTAHPRPSGDWTAVGSRGWARLEPESGHVVRADPAQDRELPALPGALRRGDLVGYRVGRRAVVASSGGFVKVLRPNRAGRLVAIHRALAAASSGAPAFPRVEAASEDGAVDLTVVPGRSLHDLLRSGPDVGVLADAAAALAALHAIRPPALLRPGAPDTAARWVGIVARAEPGAAQAIAPMAAAIDAAVTAATTRPPGGGAVIVHGDCHDKNLFLTRAGPGFIDLDGVRLGLREDDLATLAVHVALRALQAGAPMEVAVTRRAAVIDAYRRSAPLDDAVLVALERAVWFRLACLYRFRSRGRPLVSTLLERARGTTDA
ncbi:MAG TPA: phosphotransferase [Acidimicrobiales bacterium]|nr:phosphotransferase [Acidimicrobiales bacterium]